MSVEREPESGGRWRQREGCREREGGRERQGGREREGEIWKEGGEREREREVKPH